MPKFQVEVFEKTYSAVVVEATDAEEAERKADPDFHSDIVWDGDMSTGVIEFSAQRVDDDTPLGCIYK